MSLSLLHRILLVLLALPSWLAAQELPLQQLGQKDGLRNLTVTALAQDGRGYIWAGTENGLFRFNGAEFRHVPLGDAPQEEQSVTAVLYDGHDQLWVGSEDGLFYLHEQRLLPVRWRGQQLRVRQAHHLASTANGKVLVIGERQLYVVTMEGAQPAVQPYFSAQRIQAEPALGAIIGLYAEPDGTIWLGCKASLCRLDGAHTRVFGSAQGLPEDDWNCILRDKGGTLWVRSKRHVFALPPGASRFVDRTPPAELRKVIVRTELGQDAEGQVLTNADPGLLRWRREGGWSVFGPANGLHAGGGVTAVLVDRERGLWVGTLGRGLIHWMGYGVWENWGSAQGLPDDVVISFLRDRAGRLHVGTRSGHAVMAPHATRFQSTPTLAVLSGHQWSSMTEDRRGRIWATTYSGLLLRLTAQTNQVELMARMPQILYQVRADGHGTMWIATNGGLRSLPENSAPGSEPATSLAGLAVGMGCADRRGQQWFISPHHLLRGDGPRWDKLPLDELTVRQEFAYLACAADGSFWAATSTSLWHLTLGARLTAQRVDVPLLRTRAIQGLAEDRRGWLWVGTDAGVAVWNRSRWRLLNQSHGLAWDDTNGVVFYEDTDGSMWIATSNGASHITDPQRLFQARPPEVVVESMLRGGRPVTTRDLPWSPDPLSFQLGIPVYQDRQALRYRYRLVGAEDQWNESALPEVRYGALQGGEYRFQFSAFHADSGESAPVQEILFSIAPPWWRSKLFYAFCVATTLLGFALLHRYRLRALTRRQVHLATLVRERTRELEASQEELRVRALKDGLTGVWNRGAIMEALDRAIDQGERKGERFLLILLDLDYFKRINDTHGHPAGDAVLVEVARRLTSAVRHYDAVGRYGGEEFIVLLMDIDAQAGAARVEALHEIVRASAVDLGGGVLLPITASFGVAGFVPNGRTTAAALLREADQALYRAKGLGRDRVAYAAEAALS